MFNVTLAESLMENSNASAHRCLFTQLISETHTGIEVVVIADVGLIFETHSERQIEFLGDLEVVLNESGKFKLLVVQERIAGSSRELKRRRIHGADSS